MVGVVMASLASNIGSVLAPGTTSLVIPSDVTTVQVWLQAAGGGSFGRVSPADGSAGGGGGYCYLERAVLAGEWGTSLTVAIGAGVAAATGGATTLSGTLNGSAVSVTASGGGAGTSLADGSGGAASGGTVNVAGQAGSGFVAGPPGDEQPGVYGRAGGLDQPGAIAGAGYGPGDGGIASNASQPGADGYMRVIWS
jgi:hypothetical protein